MRIFIFSLFILLLSAPAQAAAVKNTWTVLHEKSSITFKGKQMGAVFEGSFDRFSTQILFDPDNLPESRVKASVDISSVDTKASDRDENIRGKEWFDVVQFPYALFETKSIRKTGTNAYEADGALTIKGITVPLKLPFKLVIEKRASDGRTTALMDADITLDRATFRLGAGNWADTSVIANEVPVHIHLAALRNE